MDMNSIPTLSIRDAALPSFVEDLHRAFVHFGFVALRDHGLPQGLRARAFAEAEALFALPDEDKRALHQPGGGGARGYTPFFVEVAKDQSVADLKEFFHVGRSEVFVQGDRGPTTEESEALSALPKNVWPPGLLSFSPTLLELYKHLEQIGAAVLRAIALGLGLVETYFEDKVNVGNSILRLLHYPPIQDAPPGAVRAAAHEDINLITLLVGSEQPGLEVQRRDGVWIPAPSGDELIICNVGDMLERLTNNVLPSTTHRVVNPQPPLDRHSRYSLPFFLHPNSDFLIESLPGCVTTENPNRYPTPILADDFLKMRLREIGLI